MYSSSTSKVISERLPPCGGSGLKLLASAVMASLSGLPPYGGSGLKCCAGHNVILTHWSPSVWREWIEMSCRRQTSTLAEVSLRVEGVD